MTWKLRWKDTDCIKRNRHHPHASLATDTTDIKDKFTEIWLVIKILIKLQDDKEAYHCNYRIFLIELLVCTAQPCLVLGYKWKWPVKY